LPLSRNSGRPERKRPEWGGEMLREGIKRSDAKHIAWINLIWDNRVHYANLLHSAAHNIYTHNSIAEVNAQASKEPSGPKDDGRFQIKHILDGHSVRTKRQEIEK